MPLRRRISAWCATCATDEVRARARTDGSLPLVLARLADHYAAELEVDPALARDLTGPFAALGDVLSLLLDRALACGSPPVALHVDVVGDDIAGQLVHFTVVDGCIGHDRDGDRLRTAAAIVASIGGVVHAESGADCGGRIIVELAFDLPRTPPRIDVNALRSTLGGEAAMREVIIALDRALSSDLAELEILLEHPGSGLLQAWLHRVSGALGMAEASELSRIGLALEHELENGRRAHLDRAIRRFAEDAASVLRVLREEVPALGYSPES
jgi:HPt (histidine-containing phosphotransfer) domain-containing protein